MLKNLNKKQKYTILTTLFILVVLAGVSYAVINKPQNEENQCGIQANNEEEYTSIWLESDKVLSINNKDKFQIRLKSSSLPSNIYSSASFSISFDKEKVEFVNIDKGDITTFSSTQPSWKYDAKASNKRGLVNVLYLDKTGGKESFTRKSISSKERNNIFIMQFKLKDKIKKNDKLKFKIKDGIFATVKGDRDDSTLSIKNKNINFKNCNVKIE